MQPAERGTLDQETVEQAGREIGDSYLCRTVIQARVGGYVPRKGTPVAHTHTFSNDGGIIGRAQSTFTLAAQFKLDVKSARCVWNALDPEVNDKWVPAILAPALAYRPIQLWIDPLGVVKLYVPPGNRVPRNVNTIINKMRRGGVPYYTGDGRLEWQRTHLLWLRYGPERGNIAAHMDRVKNPDSIDQDLDRHIKAWHQAYGGKNVPRLWEAICTFHLPIAADTVKIDMNLTVL